ncbi:MAG: hypothetical protein ACK5T6_02425 [Pirellula sp.]
MLFRSDGTSISAPQLSQWICSSTCKLGDVGFRASERACPSLAANPVVGLPAGTLNSWGTPHAVQNRDSVSRGAPQAEHGKDKETRISDDSSRDTGAIKVA